MKLFWKNEVFLCSELRGIIYQFFPISWYCDLPSVLHCGEYFIKTTWYWGGGCSQFWCLILFPLILCGMWSVQCIVQSLPLDPIFLFLPSLTEGETLGRIWGKPRCGNPSGIFVTPYQLTSAMKYSHPRPSLVCCTYDMINWMRIATAWLSQPLATVWWRVGGVSDWLGSIP